MKKTLIALAALAATGAFAQSAVTMYGSIDVGQIYKTYTAADGSQLSKTTGIGEGMNAGNRLGFKGTEDLGGGLKANFLIESGINITNGNLLSTRAATAGQQYDGLAAGSNGNMPIGAYSTATNRQSYVGVSGGFGEVRLGYQYTNLYQLSTLSGYMNGSEQPGSDIAHLISNADFGGTRANGITYISPSFSGLTVTVQHGAGTGRETAESSTASTADKKTENSAARNSIMLSYANGPLAASYAYTAYNAKVSTAAIVVGDVVLNNFGVASIATAAAAASTTDYSAKLHQLGASYNFGVAKLTGTYNVGNRDESLTGAANNYQAAQIGGELLSLGAARPFVQIGYGKTTTNGATTGDYKTQQFGVRYDMSKRTMVYLMAGTSKDDNATGVNLAKREILGLGVYHSF